MQRVRRPTDRATECGGAGGLGGTAGLRTTVGVAGAAVGFASVAGLLGLAFWLGVNAPAGLLALVVPMGWLAVSLRSAAAGAAHWRVDAELGRAYRRAAGCSADAGARAVLDGASYLLKASQAELVLLGADGPVAYSNGGGLARRRVKSDVFDQPWLLRALGSGGVTTGTTDGVPYCATEIGALVDGGLPLGVLVARRPQGGRKFSRRDAQRAAQLAAGAQAWLPTAGPGPQGERGRGRASDLGVPGGFQPELVVLHDSARRLSGLTAGPPDADAMGQIVEELRSVERAAASVLGELSTDAGRDLAGQVDSAAGARSGHLGAEWTTTGVLAALDGAA